MYLVLIRHGESVWNKENRFTGWTDVDLSEKGIIEAREAGEKLAASNIDFKVAYTSILKRSKNTYKYISEYLNNKPIVIEDYRLNERHYGALQGLNKDEMRKKYGEEQVHIWRRSFDVRPPELDINDERFPGNDPLYSNIPSNKLPKCESLKDTLMRVREFWQEQIVNKEHNENILIVAHGNSLRALIKDLENISDQDIVNLEIPTGKPILYELDNNLKIIKKENL